MSIFIMQYQHNTKIPSLVQGDGWTIAIVVITRRCCQMLIMWGKIKNWFWQEFLGPRNKWRFNLRIALRVRWLYFKRWWRETISLAVLLMLLRRPVMLLLVGLGVPLLIFSFTGLNFEPGKIASLLDRLGTPD